MGKDPAVGLLDNIAVRASYSFHVKYKADFIIIIIIIYVYFLVHSPRKANINMVVSVRKKPQHMSQSTTNSVFYFYFLVKKGKCNFTVER